MEKKILQKNDLKIIVHILKDGKHFGLEKIISSEFELKILDVEEEN